MNLIAPTVDTLLRGVALAGLCALGTAVAATKPPAKAAKPAASKAGSAKGAKKPAVKVETGPAEATPDQIDAAERVYYGKYDCEFNQTVDIEKDAKHAAYVEVKHGKSAWIMKPVLSSTGAIRLEDVKGETLMVQIASKSMLLNVKTAHRIVDDCISAKQRELIEAAKVAKAAAEAASAGAGSGASAPAASSTLLQASTPASPGAASAGASSADAASAPR
ncbi:MAG: hypothetical protein ABI809_13185 [Caldimonas sp.]